MLHGTAFFVSVLAALDILAEVVVIGHWSLATAVNRQLMEEADAEVPTRTSLQG